MRRTLGNETCFRSPQPPLFLTPPATEKGEEEDGQIPGVAMSLWEPLRALPQAREVAGRDVGRAWSAVGALAGLLGPADPLPASLAGDEKVSSFAGPASAAGDAGVSGLC